MGILTLAESEIYCRDICFNAVSARDKPVIQMHQMVRGSLAPPDLFFSDKYFLFFLEGAGQQPK